MVLDWGGSYLESSPISVRNYRDSLGTIPSFNQEKHELSPTFGALESARFGPM